MWWTEMLPQLPPPTSNTCPPMIYLQDNLTLLCLTWNAENVKTNTQKYLNISMLNNLSDKLNILKR